MTLNLYSAVGQMYFCSATKKETWLWFNVRGNFCISSCNLHSTMTETRTYYRWTITNPLDFHTSCAAMLHLCDSGETVLSVCWIVLLLTMTDFWSDCACMTARDRLGERCVFIYSLSLCGGIGWQLWYAVGQSFNMQHNKRPVWFVGLQYLI